MCLFLSAISAAQLCNLACETHGEVGTVSPNLASRHTTSFITTTTAATKQSGHVCLGIVETSHSFPLGSGRRAPKLPFCTKYIWFETWLCVVHSLRVLQTATAVAANQCHLSLFTTPTVLCLPTSDCDSPFFLLLPLFFNLSQFFYGLPSWSLPTWTQQQLKQQSISPVALISRLARLSQSQHLRHSHFSECRSILAFPS